MMNTAKFFVIRRSITIIALAVVMTFAFTACDDGSDNGGNGSGGGQTFTLIGIPAEYNGSYAALYGVFLSEAGGVLYGAQNFNMATEIATLPRIANGRVNLPMWIFINDNFVRYSGNHSSPVSVGFFNSADIPLDGAIPPMAVISFQSVTFSNGSATRAFSDGQPGGF